MLESSQDLKLPVEVLFNAHTLGEKLKEILSFLVMKDCRIYSGSVLSEAGLLSRETVPQEIFACYLISKYFIFLC